MKVLVNNVERDYTVSGGLFSSDQFQDVILLSEDNERLAWLLVEQTYVRRNRWGKHEIEGGVNTLMVTKDFKEWFEGKYGGFSLEIVNELFEPLEFTEEDEYRKVSI